VTDFEIRSLAAGDLEAAERIHRDAFGSEAWDRKAIGEVMAMPRSAGLIALDREGRAIGFALYLLVAQDAELLTIAVPHDARRKGIGRALVESFLAIAALAGATTALLEVAEDNPIAQTLYHRLGFKVSGHRKDYYRRPGNRRVGARLLNRPIP
jgi:ribosomal-protein-alanine N-acetyltransferase